jgi:hypothetical protein
MRTGLVLVVGLLVLAPVAGGMDLDFTEDDVVRAVKIAELRYAPPDMDPGVIQQRLAALYPPFEAKQALGRPSRMSKAEWLRERILAIDTPQDAERFLTRAMDRPRWLNLEVADHLVSLAEQAPRRWIRFRLRSAAAVAHANQEDLDAAWELMSAAMRAAAPDRRLVEIHDYLTVPSRSGDPSTRSELAGRFRTVKLKRHGGEIFEASQPCATTWHGACPLCRDPQLQERVASCRRLPDRPDYKAPPGPWLDSWRRAAMGFTDPADRLLALANGLQQIQNTGRLDDRWRRRIALELYDVASGLKGDPDQRRVAAAAANALVSIEGLEDHAVRMVEIVFGTPHDFPPGGEYTLRRLEDSRPAVVRSVLLRIAEAHDAETIPCWALDGLTRMDPEMDRARAWFIQLARGQCTAGGDRFNSAVEAARRKLIDAYQSEGNSRLAFAVAALHHYRSFCGNGAAAARARVRRQMAELQIAAGLDERDAAQAFLGRADQALVKRRQAAEAGFALP